MQAGLNPWRGCPARGTLHFEEAAVNLERNASCSEDADLLQLEAPERLEVMDDSGSAEGSTTLSGY